MIHRVEIVVTPEAIDANAHANNVEYVRWMQQAALAHADAAGCTKATLEAGASWVARSHHIEYLRPAFAGENLTVVTWVSNLRRSSSLRKYQILRGPELLARGETVWVFVDAKTGKPRPIVPDVNQAFTVVPPGEEPRKPPRPTT